MKKYRVVVGGGLISCGYEFISNSCNSKKHISDTGADYCDVYDMQSRQVSAARRWADNTIANIVFA